MKHLHDSFRNGCDRFDGKKLDRVLRDEKTARGKAENHLGGFFEEFKLLWQLLKDYKSGAYRNVPWKFIAAVGFAIFYLVNPFDLVPDMLPGIGYVDDVSVFGLVLASFKSEIEKYKAWLLSQPESPVRTIPPSAPEIPDTSMP
ncbi:MAG: DUF1232 domain-containing protein [Victivallaceae bacterium]|nr:DUF1232 domain-containing protein [Victivallaceae bacterium]